MATIEDFRAWYDRDLGRWAPWDKAVHVHGISDTGDHREINIHIFTDKNRYSIKAREPWLRLRPAPLAQPADVVVETFGGRLAGQFMNDGYLGCTAVSRRWRAGEDWHRGADLIDGKLTPDTWHALVSDILAYEMVEVVKTARKHEVVYPHPSVVPPPAATGNAAGP